MPSFDPGDPVNPDAVDFELVREGFVTKFWRRSVLDETTRWLAEHGYDVVTVDTAGVDDLYLEVGRALDFPDYFVDNPSPGVNQLDDCFFDLACGDFGLDPATAGLVLVLLHFDTHYRTWPRLDYELLDVFARHARMAALIGYRMMLLIQSDDPDLLVDDVGASAVPWNRAEWLDANRRPDDTESWSS